jgi:hypothetical protein
VHYSTNGLFNLLLKARRSPLGQAPIFHDMLGKGSQLRGSQMFPSDQTAVLYHYETGQKIAEIKLEGGKRPGFSLTGQLEIQSFSLLSGNLAPYWRSQSYLILRTSKQDEVVQIRTLPVGEGGQGYLSLVDEG